VLQMVDHHPVYLPTPATSVVSFSQRIWTRIAGQNRISSNADSHSPTHLTHPIIRPTVTCIAASAGTPILASKPRSKMKCPNKGGRGAQNCSNKHYCIDKKFDINIPSPVTKRGLPVYLPAPHLIRCCRSGIRRLY
jgi:hypothetical protein